jgi:hypothetical protein
MTSLGTRFFFGLGTGARFAAFDPADVRPEFAVPSVVSITVPQSRWR